ncbi:MAG: hypothetical protein K9M57_07500 [Phycisphaerae bacterium]|nr:hypothetical protein [Phycisphaerae bacterium]
MLSGCNLGPSDAVQGPTIADLSAQIVQLTQENCARQREIDTLQGQLETLQGFGPDRMGLLVQLDRIKFGRYTLAYDEDQDGLDDGITVYLKCYDSQNDDIKSVGHLKLELWDLAAVEGERLIDRWEYSPQQLGDYWMNGFLAYHYKFQLPWDQGKKPGHSNLTLKCKLKDVLSGKVFEIQKMVEVSVVK